MGLKPGQRRCIRRWCRRLNLSTDPQFCGHCTANPDEPRRAYAAKQPPEIRTCVHCRRFFKVMQCEIRKGGGKFCSKKCLGQSRVALKPGELRCVKCKARRGTKAKGAGLCRRCAIKRWAQEGRRSWQYATDTRATKAERASRVWLETDERPRVNPKVPLGSVTRFGTVAAVGMDGNGRYYMLRNVETGAVTLMAAADVEGR